MNLKELTEEEFLVTKDLTHDPSVAFQDYLPAYDHPLLMGQHLATLGQGYEIYQHGENDPGNVQLRHDGEFIGFYVGVLIAIDPRHGGKGLSVPLILEAVKRRPLPESRILGRAGKAALSKAWRVANGLEKNPWITPTPSDTVSGTE